jgi:hypothetical protein
MKNLATFEEFVAKSTKTDDDKEIITKTSTSKKEDDDDEDDEEDIDVKVKISDDDDDDDDDANEGNKFVKALKDARDQGLKEFDFEGKTYKVFEGNAKGLEKFLSENFTLYPSYNNMIGSEVMRNVPITHQINMAVYGRAYVIEMPKNQNNTLC